MACKFCKIKYHNDGIYEHGSIIEDGIWEFTIVKNPELGIILCPDPCRAIYDGDETYIDDPALNIDYCPMCGEKLDET